jgi:hypothetical protein
LNEKFREKVGGFIFRKDGIIQRHHDVNLSEKIKKEKEKDEIT